jgi:RecA-family ATPase
MLRLAALLGSELDNLPAPEWLIDGVLPKAVVAALYGPSGIGKSFGATAWDLSIASGSWWQGRSVIQGPVLYVAGEGSFGLAQRRRAWMKHENIYKVDGDTWLPRTVNLLDPGWAAALVEFAQALNPVLIIIDTVARAMQGGDENSSKDMGNLIAGADACHWGDDLAGSPHSPEWRQSPWSHLARRRCRYSHLGQAHRQRLHTQV